MSTHAMRQYVTSVKASQGLYNRKMYYGALSDADLHIVVASKDWTSLAKLVCVALRLLWHLRQTLHPPITDMQWLQRPVRKL